MNKNKIISIVAVVVIAGIAFFGGMKYGQAKSNSASASARANFGGQAGGAGGRGTRNANGGFNVGGILSKDDKSITIQIQSGGSKIVFTTASTTVSKMTPGTMADLQVGENVMVQGMPNSDGSVTAQSIQIRPAGLPGGLRGQQADQQGSTSAR